jgi:dTDP-4-amino-4,6-dideoxygalactose transaminase
VVTNHDHVAEVLRMLVDHGQRRKYHHERLGWNGRMDGIQGAVLGVKMNHIEAWTEARRTNAHRYEAALGSLDWLTLPWEAPGRRHVYHLYVVRAADREDVMAALREQDVACGIHYPIPVHLQDACRDLGYTHGCFPVAERTAAEFISLPMYPELTEAQIEHVARALRAYPQRGRLAA